MQNAVNHRNVSHRIPVGPAARNAGAANAAGDYSIRA